MNVIGAFLFFFKFNVYLFVCWFIFDVFLDPDRQGIVHRTIVIW